MSLTEAETKEMATVKLYIYLNMYNLYVLYIHRIKLESEEFNAIVNMKR